MLTMLLFAGLLAIGISWLSAGLMAGRIERVRAATRQLASGEPVELATLDIAGHDEIADLARDFNHMAASLQQATHREREVEAARRNLIAAVSHDLRTPLAAVRVMIEAMADGIVSDPEIQRRYLGASQREIQHLSQLVDDLFELAQIDAGALRLQRERASLRDLVSDTLASFQPRAELQGVALAGSVASDVDPVMIDSSKIQRVLANLLENALRHTPPGGAIRLSTYRNDDVVEVEVADSGHGIDPADLPHVFERSYRGDPARARFEAEGPVGAGLGLTIARGLIEAHGGTIRVESALGSGTRILFTLQHA
jgi:signal transduction histidine kinase